MMKTTTTTFAAALLAVLSSQGNEEGRRPPHGGPPHPGMGLMRVLDADKDRVISAEEIANSTMVLQGLDENEDGSVTPAELRPAPPEGAPEGEAGTPPEAEEGAPPPPPGGDRDSRGGRGPRPPMSPLFAVLDTDRDGSFSATEIEAAPQSLATLDRNGDGTLSPRELHPGPPRGPREEND